MFRVMQQDKTSASAPVCDKEAGKDRQASVFFCGFHKCGVATSTKLGFNLRATGTI